MPRRGLSQSVCVSHLLQAFGRLCPAAAAARAAGRSAAGRGCGACAARRAAVAAYAAALKDAKGRGGSGGRGGTAELEGRLLRAGVEGMRALRGWRSAAAARGETGRALAQVGDGLAHAARHPPQFKLVWGNSPRESKVGHCWRYQSKLREAYVLLTLGPRGACGPSALCFIS